MGFVFGVYSLIYNHGRTLYSVNTVYVVVVRRLRVYYDYVGGGMYGTAAVDLRSGSRNGGEITSRRGGGRDFLFSFTARSRYNRANRLLRFLSLDCVTFTVNWS